MKCQSCKLKPIEIVESIDDSLEPYKLCNECHYKLINYSLRPIEWYNLAAIHTYHKSLLHDDFYDDDGTACQPELEMDSVIGFEAPLLSEVENELSKLIEYSIAKWWLDVNQIESYMKFEKEFTMRELKSKFERTENCFVRSRLYEIAFSVLGPFCSEWIRTSWIKMDINYIVVLSKAAYYCLPFDEAFDLVINALNSVDERDKASIAFSCLHVFRSERTLDWIENNIESLEGIETVARLVVSSKPSWSKMYSWIVNGRPLSLIAITSLSKLVPNPNEPVLKRLRPKPFLCEPESIDEMTRVLLEYSIKDNVPRVKNGVSRVLENWIAILEE